MSGFSKVFFPSPPQEKGNLWGHPTPRQGAAALGTLLRSTFEKPWIHGTQFRAIKNIQVLIVLDVIVNLL
jgi:hypothetical protein